jgi:hypothetical protein
VRPEGGVDFSVVMRRLPALLAVAALSLVLGWLVVRTTLVNAYSRSLPQQAAIFAPEDPRVVAGLVNFELRTKMGVAGPAVKRKARRAILRAPLMEEPFLLGGIDSLMKRDTRRAQAFLDQALRRSPRSRLARLFMLELQLRGGDAKSAAANMTILSRLMPDVQKLFVPELARLAMSAETRPALAEALRSDPVILKAVLQQLATKNAPLPIILQLAGNNPPPPNDADPADWRRTLLESLVRKGDLVRARQLWARFSGVDPESADAIVYDGSFEGLPGLPPFNWAFSSSEIGAAERDRSGGLFVEYYGRAPGDLASQLITLAPGRYRFSFQAEGDLNTPQHRMIWRVQCHRNNATIMELPISNVTYAGRLLAGDFNVPSGCPSQWLKLVGQPTEFPKIENVLIRNVRMQPIGAAR